MNNCWNCYEHLRYGCGGKGGNMDEKQPCWKPDYDILWKAFRLAVMGVLTFSRFIYSDNQLNKTMERYLEYALEKAKEDE
jgi:hypothetical protein